MKPNIADIDLVKKIEDFNGDIGAHKELIGKLMTRNEMLRRENLDLEMELQNYQWAHGELRKDKENQTKEIDAMQNVIKGHDEEIDRLQQELDGANNLIEQLQNGSKVEMLERLLEKQDDTIGDQRREIDRLRKALEQSELDLMKFVPKRPGRH